MTKKDLLRELEKYSDDTLIVLLDDPYHALLQDAPNLELISVSDISKTGLLYKEDVNNNSLKKAILIS